MERPYHAFKALLPMPDSTSQYLRDAYQCLIVLDSIYRYMLPALRQQKQLLSVWFACAMRLTPCFVSDNLYSCTELLFDSISEALTNQT